MRILSNDELVTLIEKYYDTYGEVEIKFENGNSLICFHENKRNCCTWWLPQIPKEKIVYVHDIHKYILFAIENNKIKEIDVIDAFGRVIKKMKHIIIRRTNNISGRKNETKWKNY